MVYRMLLKCIFSPNLYKIYKESPTENLYQPNIIEKWSNMAISWMTTMWKIGLYTSPICVSILVYKYSIFEVPKEMASYVFTLTFFVTICLFMRACGRATNPKYVEFIQAIDTKNEKKRLENMRKYDFDFRHWPINYSVQGSENNRSSRLFCNLFATTVHQHLPIFQRMTLQVLAFFAVHTFGLRLIYPGSLTLLHTMLWNDLLYGRMILVQNYNGQRAKIRTSDRNKLDTMFVDNRSSGSRGKTLVICCEGNAGFYEIGIMTTPLKAGYSALGWNHPGFAGSTGSPYPNEEKNAVDAVVQYAINELGFHIGDIVLFGWSIGGYTSTWAASAYPEIKALILDATFDDILPLAKQHMLPFLEPVVREVIRGHVDLHVAQLLEKYPGPVQLIRRTNDEIICLRPNQIATNCGNMLAAKLIQHRHREARQPDHAAALFRLVGMTEQERERAVNTDAEKEVALLIAKYMTDVESTHCVQLSETHFEAALTKTLKQRI